MTGTSIAMVCANAAMAGLDALMPIEEIAESMAVLGERMVQNECNYHGCCDTPTAQKIGMEMYKKSKKCESCRERK